MKKFVSVVFALILVSILSVSAFAASSVVADVVKDYDGGSVTYSQDADDNEFTFTANPKDGYDFIGWEIEGDYEIVKGSLEDESITVRFLEINDLESVVDLATPVFEAVDEEVPGGKEPAVKDPVSPGTGDSMAVAALAVVALGGMIATKKRLSK